MWSSVLPIPAPMLLPRCLLACLDAASRVKGQHSENRTLGQTGQCRSAPYVASFEPWHSGLSTSKKNRTVTILKNALYSFTCVMAFNVPPHPRAEKAERAWLHFIDEEPEIDHKVLLAHLQREWSQEHNPALLSALQPHPFSRAAGSVQKHSALVFTYRRLNFIKNIFTNKMRETITKKFILRIYRNYISIQFFTFIKSFKFCSLYYIPGIVVVCRVKTSRHLSIFVFICKPLPTTANTSRYPTCNYSIGKFFWNNVSK